MFQDIPFTQEATNAVATWYQSTSIGSLAASKTGNTLYASAFPSDMDCNLNICPTPHPWLTQLLRSRVFKALSRFSNSIKTKFQSHTRNLWTTPVNSTVFF